MVTDISKIICNSLQNTDGVKDGWRKDSLCTMAKHWPGGSCEGGRESHYPFGKFSAYPNNNFEEHLKPFIEMSIQT